MLHLASKKMQEFSDQVETEDGIVHTIRLEVSAHVENRGSYCIQFFFFL